MSSLKRQAGALLCRLARLAERLLPVALVRLCAWMIAAPMAFRELIGTGPTLNQLQRLPTSIRPQRSVWRLWRQRVAVNASSLVRFWPDRLQEPRWQGCCRLYNAEALDGILRTRPVILATLHYCSLVVLCHWLRSRGWPMAALSARSSEHLPAYRKRLDSLADQQSGLADVPRFFGLDELWEARDFLSADARSLLLVAVDAPYGKRPLTVSVNDFELPIQTGAFRLAALSNAVVVPCLIRAVGGMGVEIRFGNPIPDHLIMDQRQHSAAAEQLFEELLPVIGECPEQCHADLVQGLVEIYERNLAN